MFEKILTNFKFSNKALTYMVISLITLLPVVYVFSRRVTTYDTDLSDIKGKLNSIETKLDDTKNTVDNITNDQESMKEKQNQIYYLMTENNKLVDDKLQFMIEHREQDKKTIIDAIKLISGNQKINSETSKNQLIFKEKEINTNEDAKKLNKDYKIVVKKTTK